MIYWLLDFWRGTTFGAARSSKWSSTRRDFLKEHPLCAVCNTKGGFLKPNEIHHCQPFHLKPELELSNSNLITLCRPHHLLVGHLMNFKSFNATVREDADLWLKKVTNRP